MFEQLHVYVVIIITVGTWCILNDDSCNPGHVTMMSSLCVALADTALYVSKFYGMIKAENMLLSTDSSSRTNSLLYTGLQLGLYAVHRLGLWGTAFCAIRASPLSCFVRPYTVILAFSIAVVASYAIKHVKHEYVSGHFQRVSLDDNV